MQLSTLATALLATANAANRDRWHAVPYHLAPDYRASLGNFTPYDRSRTRLENFTPYDRSHLFRVHYPSFQNKEDEESAEEAPVHIPYSLTSINTSTSSDQEMNYSSDSNDYSGPPFSSHSGVSISSSGSASEEYTPAGDSASYLYPVDSFKFDMDDIFTRATNSAYSIAKTLPEVQYLDQDALCA